MLRFDEFMEVFGEHFRWPGVAYALSAAACVAFAVACIAAAAAALAAAAAEALSLF